MLTQPNPDGNERRFLNLCVKSLPPGQMREAFNLHCHGQTYEFISAALLISLTYARLLVYRARTRLRSDPDLGQMYEEFFTP